MVRPALVATAIDVLEADGYLLGTPANLGYMSGRAQALLRPRVLPVPRRDGRAGPTACSSTATTTSTARRRGVERIVTGLQWKAVADPVAVTGGPDASDRAALVELGGVVAANLLL